jgi:hypothetical protein
MKKLLAVAVLAAAMTMPAFAITPAPGDGVYVGTISMSLFGINTAKPTKEKRNAVLIVDGSSGGILVEGGIGLGGSGIAGTNHAIYISSSVDTVANVSVHFGKDYKTASGAVVGAFDAPEVQTIEGKFKVKRAEEPPL